MLFALALSPLVGHAQARVQFGTITNVVAVTETSSTAQNVGTIVGGGIGTLAGRSCDQAKGMVLAAETDAEFATAERRMRLLCGE